MVTLSFHYCHIDDFRLVVLTLSLGTLNPPPWSRNRHGSHLMDISCVMQPLFSASVLADLMRPDGTSNTPVIGGETMSAELAQEIMGLQV